MAEQPRPLVARHATAARVAAPLLLFTAVEPLFYIGLTTVLGMLWDGYDQLQDTQSELGAVDSPYGRAMNFGGFAALGLGILAFAVVYALAFRRGRVQLLTVALLGIAGAGMVTVSFFPCDAACVDVTDTGRLHGVFSAPAAIGLPAAAMLSAYVFTSDVRFGTRWQAVSFWLGLLSLASGPLIAAELFGDANGLLQRAGMWPPLLWMTAVSLRLRAADA